MEQLWMYFSNIYLENIKKRNGDFIMSLGSYIELRLKTIRGEVKKLKKITNKGKKNEKNT